MADPKAKKSNNNYDKMESGDESLSFSQILNAFAETLPKNEQALLTTVIFNLLDPIERMKWRNVSSLLEPNEREILNNLESEWARK